MPFDDEPAISA